jgi:hypothetical protein
LKDDIGNPDTDGADVDYFQEALEEKEEELKDTLEELDGIGAEQEELISRILEDPYKYFVEEQGLEEDFDSFLKHWGHIDVEEAAKDAVSTDGVGHFLSSYDGELREIRERDEVYWRTN